MQESDYELMWALVAGHNTIELKEKLAFLLERVVNFETIESAIANKEYLIKVLESIPNHGT